MMQIDVIYSEIFELFLILRQLFSGERFKPYNKAMEQLASDLNEEELKRLEDLGILTNGYLSALGTLISLYAQKNRTDDSLLRLLCSDPELLFIKEEESVNDERVQEYNSQLLDRYEKDDGDRLQYGRLIRKIWSDGVCREKGNRSRWILNEIEELEKFVKGEELLSHLNKLSDRFDLEGEHIIFKIKPELKMKINEIGKILVMPSLFASRKLTFWYEGKTLFFFLSPKSNKKSPLEPTDMHLLYSSALNDRTRLRMLKIIARRNCTAGDLAADLDLNASTVSRHLKLFKDAGFIDLASNDGRQIVYAINQNGLKQALESLEDFVLN